MRLLLVLASGLALASAFPQGIPEPTPESCRAMDCAGDCDAEFQKCYFVSSMCACFRTILTLHMLVAPNSTALSHVKIEYAKALPAISAGAVATSVRPLAKIFLLTASKSPHEDNTALNSDQRVNDF
ncbi:hypothetical protein M501DRAFT_1017730 [Patellaria atrata CBS 101060]|uniref:Extracellular membrane protein CFEM domain-containing protein n=1 Tax=Patellaria atrata CBS 101060 TaxID=1346257 RepID=A0A9P4S8E9_9PEZI|nr:hypothetical protein M501DRAFT_1017730 [Patellaria atrata CBS 101060]